MRRIPQDGWNCHRDLPGQYFAWLKEQEDPPEPRTDDADEAKA